MEQYREQKAVYDTRLNNLTQLHSTLVAQTSKMKMDNEEQAKIRGIANDISSETSLTQVLVEMLIEKVYVHPNNRIEIVWKIENFAENAVEMVEEVSYA